ncbi:MAG: oligosaccharide flippase family protein [Flavobacteriaceae bacterium]
MSENKKIAKNTIVLYIRLVITTVIGLFSARIILQELGASDFGLYAVVGGIVAMMNFLNTTMIATSYRYIAVELGRGEKGEVNKIFNITLIIHIMLVLALVIFAETVGIYYIHHYLNVDTVKIPDAIFVLRFSVLATAFSILAVPFQALITAQEKFVVRVSIEIIRALLKLVLVILLIYYIGNKLRYFAVLMFFVMLVPPLLFFSYSVYKYQQIVKWHFQKRIEEYISMLKYTMWIMIGAIASIGKLQGTTIILNLFYGTVVNAAYGIANQLNTFIRMFATNLSQAAVPQITKSYSGGDETRTLELAYAIPRYTFFMMLIPAVPMIIGIEPILKLWLGEVPAYTSSFAVLMILEGLIASLGGGLDAMIQATGKIKKFQIAYTILSLAILPLTYFLFKMGLPPYVVVFAFILSTVTIFLLQLIILQQLTTFSILGFYKSSLKKISFVLTIVLPLYMLSFLINDNIYKTFSILLFVGIVTIFTIIFIGLKNKERLVIKKMYVRMLNKIRK